MKKGKINFIRLLFSAVVSAVLFYIVARGIFLFFWNFNLISERHWLHIWNKWQSGWVIRKPKEVMFFIAVLLLIPGYLTVWFSVYVFPWLKVLRMPLAHFEKKKQKRLQAQSLAAAVGPADKQEIAAKKKEQEKVIKISSEKLQQIDHLRGKKTNIQHSVAKQSAGTDAPAATSANTPQTTHANEAAARFDLWEKLAQSLESENIFILRQMKIKSFPVNIFAITQEGLFLLCEGPATGQSWEVNETADPPVWNTEKAPIPSPLRPVIASKAILQTYFAEKMPQYAGLDINCCMILDHGNVTNPDQLLSHLEDWDISVLRMGSCQTTSLPDTQALINYIKSQPVSEEALNDSIAVAILDLMENDDG